MSALLKQIFDGIFTCKDKSRKLTRKNLPRNSLQHCVRVERALPPFCPWVLSPVKCNKEVAGGGGRDVGTVHRGPELWVCPLWVAKSPAIWGHLRKGSCHLCETTHSLIVWMLQQKLHHVLLTSPQRDLLVRSSWTGFCLLDASGGLCLWISSSLGRCRWISFTKNYHT